MKTKIGTGLTIYKDPRQLDHAAALLSRLIARRAASFRLQYGFRYMRQTNVALCRWKELAIIETIENIHGGISAFEVDGQFNIPTAVNFGYLLTRLQCAAKMLLRIISCAKEAFNAFLGIIQKAYFVDITTAYLGLLANIWQICVELCHSTVKLYNDIVVVIKPHLQTNQISTEPTIEYPNQLDEWLGAEYTEANVQTKAVRKQKLDDDSFSIDISEFDNAEVSAAIKIWQASKNRDKTINVVAAAAMVPNQRPQAFVKIETKQPKLQMKQLNELRANQQPNGSKVSNKRPSIAANGNLDLGEALCRDTLQVKQTKIEPDIQPRFVSKFAPKMKPVDIHRIKTMNDIQRFISSEEALRKCQMHESSKVLNNDDWKRFKLKINDLIATMEPWQAVKRFRNVWYNFNATNK